MSLIHDALKRAERERGQPPGVVVPGQAAYGEPARKRGPVWPWLVAVTVIPAAALGGWAAWNGSLLETPGDPEPVLAEGTPDESGERSGNAGLAGDESSGESRHLASAQVEPAEDDSEASPGSPGEDGAGPDSGQQASESRAPAERPASSEQGDSLAARSDSRVEQSGGDAADEGGDPGNDRQRGSGEEEGVSAEPKDDPETSPDDEAEKGVERASSTDAEAEPEPVDEARRGDETSETSGRQSESSPAETEAEAGKARKPEGESDGATEPESRVANAEREDETGEARARQADPAPAENDEKPDDGSESIAKAESRAAGIDLRARHEAWRSALADGDMAKAKEELAEVRDVLPPDHLMRLRMEGWTAYRQGDLERAVDRYRRVTDRRPGDVESALNLASIYLSLEKPSRARAAIAEARRHSPESEALRQAQRHIGS